MGRMVNVKRVELVILTENAIFVETRRVEYVVKEMPVKKV